MARKSNVHLKTLDEESKFLELHRLQTGEVSEAKVVRA